MTEEYKYIGDFSATPPWGATNILCHDCKIQFTGCWDNFQCPQCGKGEIPSADVKSNEECIF